MQQLLKSLESSNQVQLQAQDFSNYLLGEEYSSDHIIEGSHSSEYPYMNMLSLPNKKKEIPSYNLDHIPTRQSSIYDLGSSDSSMRGGQEAQFALATRMSTL